ncbi:MAG: MFS transporter [Pseudomonadota bacterium]
MNELTRYWRIVLACFFGVSLSATSIPFYTLGAFTVPLQTELGWARAEVQAAMAFLTLGSLLTVPFVGAAIDRWGTRAVGLVSIAVFGLAFMNIGWSTSSLSSFYLNWTLMSALGAGTTPITWTRAINGWFDKQRGVALGFALAGTGVAGFVTPQVATYLIEAYGWRNAYMGLGVFPLVISLPLVFLLLRNPTGNDSAGADNAVPTANLHGVTLRQAVGQWKFWAIIIAFFIISFGIGGTIPNLIPLLIDGGMDRATAAGVAGSIGLSVIFGRVVAGFLIDRFWAPAVAFLVFSLPAISCWILSTDVSSIGVATFAAVLIGLAAGAEFDMIAYLTSRYFGLKHYGKIYAWPFAAFSVGAGIAPFLFGRVRDSVGNYGPILLAAALFYIAGSAILLTLGRYPRFDRESGT